MTSAAGQGRGAELHFLPLRCVVPSPKGFDRIAQGCRLSDYPGKPFSRRHLNLKGLHFSVFSLRTIDTRS